MPFGVTDFTVTHTGNIEAGTAVPNRGRDARQGRCRPRARDQSRGRASVHDAKNSAKTEVAVPGFGFYEAPKCKAGGLGPHETGPESTVIGEEKAIVFAGTGDVPARRQCSTTSNPPKGRSALYGAALKLPIALTKVVLEANGLTGAPADSAVLRSHPGRRQRRMGQRSKGHRRRRLPRLLRSQRLTGASARQVASARLRPRRQRGVHHERHELSWQPHDDAEPRRRPARHRSRNRQKRCKRRRENYRENRTKP